MDIVNDRLKLPIWMPKFILSKYFHSKDEVQDEGFKNNCECRQKSECATFFCIPCEIGHVCRKTHSNLTCKNKEDHVYLQVRKVTHRNAVSFDDIKNHCDAQILDQIQTFKFNNIEKNILLRSKLTKDFEGNKTKRVNHTYNIYQYCQICHQSIMTMNKESKATFCSLECRLSLEEDFKEIFASNHIQYKDKKESVNGKKMISFSSKMNHKSLSISSKHKGKKPEDLEIEQAAYTLLQMKNDKDVTNDDLVDLWKKVDS